jgi:8-oxo-dGTP pyrophosphatase MutT (NUDIX family)
VSDTGASGGGLNGTRHLTSAPTLGMERHGRAWRELPPGFAARLAVAATAAPGAAAPGAAAPAAPRDAATVVLLRDAPDGRGIETYLLRRVATMAFAARMHVFPGGAVDPADARAQVAWVGPPLTEIADALRADAPLARALLCAAVRETFEETGVLLAGPDAASVADVSGPGWDDARRALESHADSLGRLLTHHGLALRADLVLPWARWITPTVERSRYDTRFFVAALPAGQQPRGSTAEADRMVWMRPTDALAQRAAGRLMMLPPTAYTLAELAEHDDVASVLTAARAREIAPIMPRIVVTGDEAHLLLPHDDGYHDADHHDGGYHDGGEGVSPA